MNVYQLFWIEFDKISKKTGGLLLSGKSREAFEIIDGILTTLQIDFCFDLTVLENKPCLIFSPEGDPDIAEKIDTIVSRRISVDEWVILSRRPAKVIQDVRAIIRNLYLIDPELCRYEISPVSRNCVFIFIPLGSDLTDSECTGFANTLFWHTLGEAEVMERDLKHEVKFGIPDKVDLLRLEEMRNQLLGADHSD